MADQANTEKRIIELELRFMEQQRVLEELSKTIYLQERAINALANKLERLNQKVATPGTVEAAADEKPPHY